MVRGDTNYLFVKDQRGSIRQVVNSETGVVEQEMSYDDWGHVTSDSNPGFQPFGFAGGLYDYETGLVRFGARDYDASVGRWLSKDPIGFEGGDTNLYGYVLNDPINFTDSNGEMAAAPILKEIPKIFSAICFRDPVACGQIPEAVDDWAYDEGPNNCPGYWNPVSQQCDNWQCKIFPNYPGCKQEDICEANTCCK